MKKTINEIINGWNPERIAEHLDEMSREMPKFRKIPILEDIKGQCDLATKCANYKSADRLPCLKSGNPIMEHHIHATSKGYRLSIMSLPYFYDAESKTLILPQDVDNKEELLCRRYKDCKPEKELFIPKYCDSCGTNEMGFHFHDIFRQIRYCSGCFTGDLLQYYIKNEIGMFK